VAEEIDLKCKKGEHLGPVTTDGVDFDKINVFCNKYYVHIDIYMFIIIKIKCINSSKICNICNKDNFITNYTYFIISDNILSKHM
jgi:hypothetical protein